MPNAILRRLDIQNFNSQREKENGLVILQGGESKVVAKEGRKR